MKKSRIIAPIAVFLSVVCAFYIYAAATYGTADDPLVTKSYIDSVVIPQIETKYQQLLDQKLEEMLAVSLEQKLNEKLPNAVSQTAAPIIEGLLPGLVEAQLNKFTANTYVVHFFPAGTVVICGEGTEFILRAGKAVAVSAVSNGLSDLTGACETLSGSSLIENHLYVCPRADGRGFTVTADAYFMIKGSFTQQ